MEKLYSQINKIKEDGIEEVFISNEIGRGVRATRKFRNKDFIVEYRGELLQGNDIKLRKKKYDKENNTKSYMLEFEHGNQKYW